MPSPADLQREAAATGFQGEALVTFRSASIRSRGKAEAFPIPACLAAA